MLAPDVEMLVADGRRASGLEAGLELIDDAVGSNREMAHEFTNVWHTEGVWIAEVSARYVLRDWHELRDVPRVFIAREGADGISELRVYGANEHPMHELMEQEEMRIGGRPMMPL
jgi:hypothetical protein